MTAPEFPPPFVIERTRSLGFGTGPWPREQLVGAWGAPMADKYIAEAKAAGWLVSPARGVYHVPPAQDVMLASWLPEPVRLEFLMSRTLAAAGIRAWCLSAWCRDQGLALPEPVFVTDLATPTPRWRLVEAKDVPALAQKAANRTSLPLLDHLLIVPAMPAMGQPQPRVSLVPEAEESVARRTLEKNVATVGLGIAGLIAYAIDKEVPDEVLDAYQQLEAKDAQTRGIPYAVDGVIQDEAWIGALLLSIGTARIEELFVDKLKPKLKPKLDDVQRWASLIGPPQPVASWKDTLQQGPYPYLLVPPSLWAQMGADQAARRFRMLQQLARR